MKRRPNQLTIRLSNSFKNPVRFGNPVRATGIARTLWKGAYQLKKKNWVFSIQLHLVNAMIAAN